MSWNTKPLIKTQGEPTPQAYDPTLDIYKVVQSTQNALWTTLKDEAGNFLGVTNGKLNIRASELEAILSASATVAKQDVIIQGINKVEAVLEKIRNQETVRTNSYIRLSTEPKPTTEEGVKEGDDLLDLDTATGAATVYVFYSGEWREI